MRNVLSIASREVRSSFVTPLVYVVLASFLILSGFFFFSLLLSFNSTLTQAAHIPDAVLNLNQWVITPYFQTLEIVIVFLMPLLTMRALAEEKRSGTYELLATSPLTIGDIVWGKFLGVGSVACFIIASSFVFPLILSFVSNPELLPALVGLLGLLLFTLALTSIGVALSAFTRSQTIAGVLGLVLFLLLYLIDQPAARLGGRWEQVLTYLAPGNHTEWFLKGVIQGEDLIYFVSCILLGAFIANRVFDAERWR